MHTSDPLQHKIRVTLNVSYTYFDNRCRFQIQLADSTGFITAMAFGQQADSMLSIIGDYLKNNIEKATVSGAARHKLGTEIEYTVHLRAYNSAPRDNEFCLFSIDTFVPITRIIEDTQELDLVLQVTTVQKNHYSKEGETESPATKLRASNAAMEDAVAHGVAAIYSGILVYYVRIDNHKLTLGWYDIVADHKFGRDYIILLASKLCQSVKQFAKELKMNTFMLVTRQRIWEIQHIAGYLIGHNWYAYVAAHTLRCHDILIFSLDSHLRLRVLIFNEAGRERTYDWY
ncbi:hypothetical protein RHMOL_Rhmol11G0012000 [Rhododendron molle]|uniref:Uncharacterized protein n=1 Tax=Rhododendron molle TaxID=49168 RepID=A0ACC0LNL1_RHOML|nr:hypothetical protein RHMOL_Rhmol11G0012000 [Rhododendron molle]